MFHLIPLSYLHQDVIPHIYFYKLLLAFLLYDHLQNIRTLINLSNIGMTIRHDFLQEMQVII